MNVGGAYALQNVHNMRDGMVSGLPSLRDSERAAFSAAAALFASGATGATIVNPAPSAMKGRNPRKRPLSVTFAPSRDRSMDGQLFPDHTMDTDAYSDGSSSFATHPEDADSTTDCDGASREDEGDNSSCGDICVTILGPGSPNDIDMTDPLERSLIWYSPEDIGIFKASARTLAGWMKRSEAQRAKDRNSCQGEEELLGLLRSYRERFDRRGGGADGTTADMGEGLVRVGIVPAELAHLDPVDVSELRGLEFRVSFERQRNKFIALRAVVTYLDRLHREAEKRGEVLTEYPVGKIAYVSNKVTRWARNLARREGLDDFREAYPHIVPKEEVMRQAAFTGVGEASVNQFPLKLKKRKSPEDPSSVSDDLSSMLSCEMSLSATSASEVSTSSMRSNMSIQSSYIKVKPFFEAVVEEPATVEQDQEEHQQAQSQQEQPKRRRRRGPSFSKAFGKKKSSSKLGSK